MKALAQGHLWLNQLLRGEAEGEAIHSSRAGRICSPVKQHSALRSAMAVAEVADLVVVTHHAVVLTLHGHADVLRQRFL
jgi:hypothetical protein